LLPLPPGLEDSGTNHSVDIGFPQSGQRPGNVVVQNQNQRSLLIGRRVV